MSAVNAARKRRAGALPVEPVRNTPTMQSNQQQPPIPQQKMGLTLPEVIALVDKRLVTLERFMNETKSQPQQQSPESVPKIAFETETDESPVFNDEIIEEFNSRFLLLTEEMTTLKDIILNLQSYTMSVNKVLMEERIQIISDLGTMVERDEEGEEENEENKREKEEDKSDEGVQEIEEADGVTTFGGPSNADLTETTPDVDENGMTKYGIPIPELIPRYKSVNFA
jgi:hypothetical protein